MKRINLFLHIVIIPLFILELVSRWRGGHTLEYAVKPWLMVWIIAYFFTNAKNHRNGFIIFIAFFFSWIGDMFLMVAHSVEVLFYAGVGGFFIAQLAYIGSFLHSATDPKRGLIFTRPRWVLPFIIYLAVILGLILKGMSGIMIPVIVIYAFSLIMMSMAALNRKNIASSRSFILVFAGSILFVLSDSMIAVNKFYFEIPKSSFLIMLTYFPAQYLIMRGLVEELKEG